MGKHLPLHFNEAIGFVRHFGEARERQRCFVCDTGMLTLDMAGNILTCQNFHADAVDEDGNRHCLGTIFDLPAGADAPMPALTRWKAYREARCTDLCGTIFVSRRVPLRLGKIPHI
ncbi:MAG: hypothetical protein LBQ51_09380 [Desulfovibrio sp.]|jgi:hypothetical protein|nr:hypothetical protein [Desulfovibrio sp.]